MHKMFSIIQFHHSWVSTRLRNCGFGDLFSQWIIVLVFHSRVPSNYRSFFRLRVIYVCSQSCLCIQKQIQVACF
uniref:Uncharacterized protein n=1 Tax=Arundo donax TaxID=35708 RepID=A0A0A9EY34_ARUDO